MASWMMGSDMVRGPFKACSFKVGGCPVDFQVKGVVGKSGFNRSFLAQSDNYTGCFQLKRNVRGLFVDRLQSARLPC